MIQQFLKLGGARNEQEFYAKYPTKESFMAAHPEAQMLDAMHRMQIGGGVPQQEDYGDNIEAFQQAQDAYLNSIPQGMSAPGAMNISQFIKAPVENPMIGPGPGVPAQVSASPSSYRGNSIMDYLRSIGEDGSFQARKKIFGPGYRGTARQNEEALATMRLTNGEDPETIGVTNPATRTVTKKKAPVIPAEQKTHWYDDKRPYKPFVSGHSLFPGLNGVGTPKNTTAENVVKNNPGLNWSGGDKVAVLTASLAGAYAAGRLGFFDLMTVADAIEGNPKWTGAAKAKVTRSINELRKQTLQKAGADVKKVAELWDKLPKKAQKLYMANFADPQLVDDIISGQIHTMPASSAVNHLATYNSTQALENALTADDELKPLLQDASEEAKAWHKFRTRQGMGLVPEVKNAVKQEVPSWLEMTGRNILKNAKGLLRREVGGDTGTYNNGAYFAAGGEYDLCEQDVQELINQGYKIEYL